MRIILAQTIQSGLGQNPLDALLALLLFVAGMVPVLLVIYLFYWLLTLPLRRTERSRMFLDLLELGLKEGQTAEQTISDASSSHDASLGVRFHVLASYLTKGMGLTQGLRHVPQFLPAEIVAMLAAGEKIGDVGKVIPACRLLLKDGISQVRGAMNYAIVLLFVTTPFTIFVPIVLRVKVLPVFSAVFAGMLEKDRLPAFTRLVIGGNNLITIVQLTLFCLVWLVAIAYIGGPRMRQWSNLILPGVADWFIYRLPWRRKRLQRDFSAMLSVLLDAEVPEPEAVRLAGEATANAVMLRRARRVQARLTEGVKLPEAIRLMDDSGELGWRLSNALRRAGGFVRALTGWHEALDARAFQLEQTAAQTVTSLIVLTNGFFVGCLVIGLFLAFIQLINEATLW